MEWGSPSNLLPLIFTIFSASRKNNYGKLAFYLLGHKQINSISFTRATFAPLRTTPLCVNDQLGKLGQWYTSNSSIAVKARIVLLTTELKPYTDPVDIYLTVSFSSFPVVMKVCPNVRLPNKHGQLSAANPLHRFFNLSGHSNFSNQREEEKNNPNRNRM